MTTQAQPLAEPTQPITLIEKSPLDPVLWEKLAAKVRSQNDPLSLKSIEMITEGLKELQALEAAAAGPEKIKYKLSVLSQSMFVRLAKAYNSPTLLKEVGLIYLRDLGLPNVALQHFERSLRLGGPEKELRPLTEAATGAVQRQAAQDNGQLPIHSGITTAQHAKVIAPNVIRKTGKMLLASGITQSAATKLTGSIQEKESDLTQPLPSGFSECLEEADQATKQGQFKRAKMLLQKAGENPADPAKMWQGWTNLGHAGYEAGQPPLVEAAFLEAHKYDPNELASNFNLALGYHLNKKHDLAQASYERANQIEPKHPKVWCNLGVLYFQMDEFEKAERALRYAAVSDPAYARAWDNLAAALGAQDKMDETIAACEQAVKLRPDYPEAYFKMGVVFFSKNELSKAAEQFQRAMLLPALSGYSDAFLAMIHARTEQPEAAEAAVLRAVKADPKCDLLWMAWNDLGLAWYTARQYQKASVAYGEATMLKPDEPEAWFNLGVSYHQTGELKAAQDSYQHAVDLDESFAGAWHNLGIVSGQNGDHSCSVKAFQNEVNWAPDNIRAWHDLGGALEKLKRGDEARIAFARAEKLSKAAAKKS